MQLLAFIIGHGWSWRQVAKASAVEVPPHDDSRQMFNEKVVASSAGMLGNVTHHLKIVTLEASHTTACLNAVRCSAKHPDSIIADAHGRLSLGRLRERSAEMAKAVEDGMEYLVICHQAEAACPKMCRLLCRAGNLDHEANQQLSSLQVLFQIHFAAEIAGDNVNWQSIADEVGRERPSFKAAATSMCDFVKTWSGGNGAPLLNAVDKFVKTLTTQRNIPGPIYAAFAQLPLAEAPTYVEASLKAMLNCPAIFP